MCSHSVKAVPFPELPTPTPPLLLGFSLSLVLYSSVYYFSGWVFCYLLFWEFVGILASMITSSRKSSAILSSNASHRLFFWDYGKMCIYFVTFLCFPGILTFLLYFLAFFPLSLLHSGYFFLIYLPLCYFAVSTLIPCPSIKFLILVIVLFISRVPCNFPVLCTPF